MASAESPSLANRVDADHRSSRAMVGQAESYQALFNAEEDGIVEVDENGRLIKANALFIARFGYSREELPGLTLAAMQMPDVAGTLARAKNSRSARVTTSLSTKKGHTVPLEATLTHVPALGRFIVCVRDAETVPDRGEQRFKTVVENVPNIAVQGYDRHRRVIFWNLASESLYGYTRDEALGKQLEDLIIPAEMRDGVIAAVAGFVDRGEQIPAGELVLRKKDGSPVFVYSSHVKFDRADGEPEMYCIDIDLSARKQAERALAEANDFHLKLLSQAPALIWRSGKDGGCDWFNTTWLEFTGRSLELEQGTGWLRGVHPDDAERCIAIYSSAFAARIPFVMEYRLRRRDGEYRWISDNGIPFTAPDGELGGFIGYCFDVTERRQAEEQIREQAALLEVAGDAILVTDLNGVITYWNRAAEAMYGKPAHAAVGRRFGDIVQHGVLDEGWSALFRTGEWSRDEQHHVHGGKVIDVRIRATLMRGSLGGPKSVFLVISDVTERKRLESQFLRAQRLESVGALASGIAHDLKNVLTPIMMSVELLRPLARTKHDGELLQLLSDSARRGSEIVQQLLIFGRGSDSPRSSLDIGSVIKDVGRLMRETFPKSIRLTVQAPSDLRRVQADGTQIQQVLLNLCVNARDAMKEGGRLGLAAENVEVERSLAAAHGVPNSGAHVCIEVTDTGTGMPADLIDKIFDPFFTTKPTGEGTGLGLATALGIVRSHHGFIDVRSTPGSGSAFRVFLPAAMTEGEPGRIADSTGPQRGNGELVLVIDDEDNIRSMVERALLDANYRVLTASDGAEAIGVFSQHASTVKLVLTDMMMPVMDGPHAVRALRLLNPSLPVLAISGLEKAQRAELEKIEGPPVHFLSKPFTIEHALCEIRRALDAGVVSGAVTPVENKS